MPPSRTESGASGEMALLSVAVRSSMGSSAAIVSAISGAENSPAMALMRGTASSVAQRARQSRAFTAS